jgi:cyanophycinase
MLRIKTLILLYISALAGISYSADNGHLLIIGGGKRPDYVMKKFVELAGGSEAKIFVIPMASAEPIETAKYQVNQIEELGAGEVSYIFCTKEEADSQFVVDKLHNSTGIFLSGGDQNRLTGVLLKTKLLKRIYEIYLSGGVIAGTSAGAAVMSKIMITGDELINKSSSSFSFIQKDNIEYTEGFGFLDNAVIDQHFIYRKRHNRLISLVLENRDKLGIGIDEQTAILYSPDGKFEVIGESQVIVYDANEASGIRTDSNNLFGASGIKMHILLHGDIYDTKSRRIVQ